MPQGKDYISFIIKDIDLIKDFIAKINSKMLDYIISHPNSKFILFYKNLTHSDLPTFGKATRINELSKNLLYYINENEMLNIERKTDKPFQTSHQSCIGLRKKLYELTGLPQPRENDPYLLNNFCKVLIVNEQMKYFKSKYTKEVFNKLGKILFIRENNWNFNEIDVSLTNEDFTEINLHVAVHGLGMAEDKEFHKLRHHMFKGDIFSLLFEITDNDKKMFIILEKNPIFFSIIGIINKSYEEYQQLLRKRLINKILNKKNVNVNLDEEVTRQQQAAWRKMLANEMMGYTSVDSQIFCPFTYITVDFDKLGCLFVASHIKGFSDPNTTNEEKYDINNGLLLCANADALFDKHLISINENKELVFSFLLDGDIKLKSQLLLLQQIFQPILNDKRMQYLKYHYELFQQLETIRKKFNNLYKEI